MAEYVLKKSYVNHFGLDLKSSELNRPIEFASGVLNAQFKKSGAIEKRKGYQAHAASAGGHGLFTYNRVNTVTGAEEPEVICVDNTARKLDTTTMSVSYSGSNPGSLISIYFDTSVDGYRCTLIENGVEKVNKLLGVGFDEATTVTVEELRTDIDAVANFTATVSGDGTVPAAFLKVVRDHDLSTVSGGSSLNSEAKYWTAINTTVSTPLSGSETNKNTEDFENASGVQIQNVFYLSNGYDNVLKYDGQTLYRAGLPNVGSIATATAVGGSVSGSNYTHVAQYIQKDNSGNLVEGNILKSANISSASSNSFDVTVANIQAGSGFNTNGAIIVGAQVSVTTLNADNGSGGAHTLKVGDTAYFYDSVSASYVEREVTAVTSSTFTIDGAAVTVADNDVVSNNLRIAIFRNKTSGTVPTVFYLVAEIPNDSFNSTQVFNDDIVDGSLGAQLIEPFTDRSPPPKGRYISSFRGQMVVCGNIENPNTVYYSDVESPEYFPTGVTTFDLDTIAGDIITGCAPNNDVFAVFKSKSIHIVSGNIADNSIRIDQLTNDIGCAAHATIREIRGSLFFVSDRGPYSMTGGQIPAPLGQNRIEPIFDQEGVSSVEQLVLKRAVAINDRDGERYIMYFPAESTNSVSDRHPNSNSKIFVYDYDRDAFLEWSNINMAGGATIIDDEFYFVERRNTNFTNTDVVDHIMYRRMNLNDAYDYQDNTSAIEFNWKTQWEALGEPSVFKRYLRIRIFTLEELVNNNLNINVKTDINYIKDSIKSNFDFNFGSSGYGVDPYGEEGYGSPFELAKKAKLTNGRFRSLRSIFSNSNEQENVVITGWEYEIATSFRPRFKE